MNYIELAIQTFKDYKSLGEKAIDQVPGDRLHWQSDEDSNSIYVIVKHLHGNMLSRWTNFMIEDGEKPWRMRDDEFVSNEASREEMLSKWEEGWKHVFDAMNKLSPEDLNKIVYIREKPQSVMRAINRQIAHYSYHIGQIVYLAKMLSDEEWNSLSIPKKK